VVDRLTEMIITGGINVFPREIEDVIAETDGVEQVAVVSGPSTEWGEEVIAYVSARGDLDLDELRAAIERHCREVLASYKIPRRILIHTEPLPLTGSGKIAKAALRDRRSADDARSPPEAASMRQ
jgi:long-chain acyl-CoA synthetase